MTTGVDFLNSVLPDFLVSSKRPRSVMAESYLLDSYSVGVESGWGSQMVGVFDSPDGCSVWCSVTLGRLIDMLPPSPPSPHLLSLHLLLQQSHCYEDGYQPPGPSQQILRGWDGTLHLAHQRKCQSLGSCWWHPFASVGIGPARFSKFQVIWGMSGHRSEVSCSMSYCNVNSKQPSAASTPWNHQPHTTDQLFLPKVWGS